MTTKTPRLDVRQKHPKAVCKKSGDGCAYYVWSSNYMGNLIGIGKTSKLAWLNALKK